MARSRFFGAHEDIVADHLGQILEISRRSLIHVPSSCLQFPNSPGNRLLAALSSIISYISPRLCMVKFGSLPNSFRPW